jgi:hypothetical protein
MSVDPPIPFPPTYTINIPKGSEPTTFHSHVSTSHYFAKSFKAASTSKHKEIPPREPFFSEARSHLSEQ